LKLLISAIEIPALLIIATREDLKINLLALITIQIFSVVMIMIFLKKFFRMI